MRLSKEQIEKKYKNTKICRSAQIEPKVIINKTASIYEKVILLEGVKIGKESLILDEACICENVSIGSDVCIEENVIIDRNTIIEKGVCVSKNSEIAQNVNIGRGSLIWNNVIIYKHAQIREDSKIPAFAEIGANRKDVHNVICYLGIGEHKKLTAYECTDGLIVSIGCMNFYKGASLEETRKIIAKKYPPNHKYFKTLDLIQTIYKK